MSATINQHVNDTQINYGNSLGMFSPNPPLNGYPCPVGNGPLKFDTFPFTALCGHVLPIGSAMGVLAWVRWGLSPISISPYSTHYAFLPSLLRGSSNFLAPKFLFRSRNSFLKAPVGIPIASPPDLLLVGPSNPKMERVWETLAALAPLRDLCGDALVEAYVLGPPSSAPARLPIAVAAGGPQDAGGLSDPFGPDAWEYDSDPNSDPPPEEWGPPPPDEGGDFSGEQNPLPPPGDWDPDGDPPPDEEGDDS